MVDASKVKFPITLDELARLQRAEMRREPTGQELELFADIVDMANYVYHAAAAGDSDAAESIFYSINHASDGTPLDNHLAALCRGWAIKGLMEGMVELKKEMNGMK